MSLAEQAQSERETTVTILYIKNYTKNVTHDIIDTIHEDVSSWYNLL
jgi:hypothetical protein